ncbi:MAG: MATE family efflux transporter [Lachnospiraceae bacterium]|nr:MATE family efflux transporter [Candidatus Minthocola equi]
MTFKKQLQITGWIHKLLKRFIGNKSFYRKVLIVTIPIMLQNAITNFVNMLDNIMVGQIGTEQMTGVSIVNQLIFVFNLCIFGGMSGPGIFTAQFYGKQDHEGVRHTFRFKLLVAIIVSILGFGVLSIWGEELIQLYLSGETAVVDADLTLKYAKDYLAVAVWGLLPFALSNVYSTTMRESMDTMKPMLAGMIAVIVNLVFNWILIYGKFGLPALGVAGAAIATVMSRFVEVGILALWTHKNPARYPYIKGVYSSLEIPSALMHEIIRKGLPLLFNETLWSMGIATINQIYSVRGLDVMAASNICMTLVNLGNVVFLAMGNSIAILIGQRLGAGQIEEAVDEAPKMIAFSMFCGLITGGLTILLARAFPMIYNTNEEVRILATSMIIVFAAYFPVGAFCNGTYFTLRSGGRTVITFLFDSAYVWSVQIPVALAVTYLTDLPIIPIIAIVQGTMTLKIIIGSILVKKRIWVRNMVAEK